MCFTDAEPLFFLIENVLTSFRLPTLSSVVARTESIKNKLKS
jgi:hypothetical protein